MRAALPFILAAVLGVGSGVLAACGGSSGGSSALIPQSSAQRMSNALDDVKSAVDDGNCQRAQLALARARGVLVNLPASVDRRLRVRLRQGLDNLKDIVPDQCQKQSTSTQTTTTPPATTTTNTTPSTATTNTTTTTPTSTTGTTTTPPTTSTTTTTPPPTTTTTAPPADTTGGATQP